MKVYLPTSILLFLALMQIQLLGQQNRIGIVHQDSILLLLPGYKEVLDSNKNDRLTYDKTLSQMDRDILSKTREADSLYSGSDQIGNQFRRQRIEQLEANRSDYKVVAMEIVLRNDSIRKVPYERKFRRAQAVVSNKLEYAILDTSNVGPTLISDGTVFINVDTLIANEIRNPSTINNKFRVGFINSDSLLLLMPGYKSSLDSAQNSRLQTEKTLKQMDAEYDRAVRARDSLKEKSSATLNRLREMQIMQIDENRLKYKALMDKEINYMDSVRYEKYNRPLMVALDAASKNYKCIEAHDVNQAQEYWSPQDAAFINLNVEVAKELGLY